MANRRNQIIERAAAVVYQKGFGATTVADILVAAAVGKGNFYHYFKGKEDLGLAIIDVLSHEIGGVDLDEVFSPIKPPLQRLRDYLKAVGSARRLDCCGDPLCTLASELGATSPYADRIREAMAGLTDRLEALVGEAALEAQAAVSAHVLARGLLAQIHGLCIQYKVDRSVEALEAGLAAVPSTLTAALETARHADAGLPAGRAQAAGR